MHTYIHLSICYVCHNVSNAWGSCLGAAVADLWLVTWDHVIAITKLDHVAHDCKQINDTLMITCTLPISCYSYLLGTTMSQHQSMSHFRLFSGALGSGWEWVKFKIISKLHDTFHWTCLATVSCINVALWLIVYLILCECCSALDKQILLIGVPSANWCVRYLVQLNWSPLPSV